MPTEKAKKGLIAELPQQKIRPSRNKPSAGKATQKKAGDKAPGNLSAKTTLLADLGSGGGGEARSLTFTLSETNALTVELILEGHSVSMNVGDAVKSSPLQKGMTVSVGVALRGNLGDVAKFAVANGGPNPLVGVHRGHDTEYVDTTWATAIW